MVGIDVKTGDPVFDDLLRPAIEGGKHRQAGGHRLDHGQAKGLEQRRLHECAMPIGDEPVELSGHPLLQMGPDPTQLAIETILVHQAVHPFDLLLLLPIVRLLHTDVARDDQQVGGLPQRLATPIPRHQAGDVLDLVQAGHGEQQRFVPVGQLPS